MMSATSRSDIDAAYRRGHAAGVAAVPTLRPEWTASIFGWARQAYPASRELDYWDELVVLDAERLNNPPDALKYPETRGLPDLLRAERQGFADGCGGGARELAFHYTWSFFCSRRLNTRYIGTGIRANHCSEVYIRDSQEGGPLFGRNLDDVRRPGLENFVPPREGPSGKRQRHFWTDSGAVLCDEEPREIFPVDVWSIMPPDCRSAGDTTAFLRRYSDFWGPASCLMVDEEHTVVVIEKSNCRMGVRDCPDGVAVITACSYLIPEMKAFRDERHRVSLELRGWDETAPDAVYWKGCDARHERLWQLAKAAAAKGPTLDDMAAIMTDHAVPFPDRICLAGETAHAGDAAHQSDAEGNWTLTSESAVLEGPNRRSLFFMVDGGTPCYENPPVLTLGPGVAMQPGWA